MEAENKKNSLEFKLLELKSNEELLLTGKRSMDADVSILNIDSTLPSIFSEN